jgi:L-cystine transport system permease protein
MTTSQALRRFVLPQAIPEALPNLCNNLTASVKSSALAFTISVVDMLNGALLAATHNYRYSEAYCAAAVLYWVLCFAIERSVGVLEKRVGTHTEGARL